MWWAKQAISTLQAVRADGTIVTAVAGDWLIYPAPQVTDEFPNTLTTETDENIDTLYT